MRRPSRLLVVAVLILSSGCSDGSFGVEFIESPETVFTAHGAAVDEGIVCASLSATPGTSETVEGDPLSDDEAAALMEAASTDEGVAEFQKLVDFVCDDGSGEFTMRRHVRFDFSTFDFEGQHEIGTWEIEHGDGSYAGLSGSGSVTMDFDNEQNVLAGELNTN